MFANSAGVLSRAVSGQIKLLKKTRPNRFRLSKQLIVKKPILARTFLAAAAVVLRLHRLRMFGPN